MAKTCVPQVTGFFDDATNAVSYVVADPGTNACAVIDSVLDFDVVSGAIGTEFADRIIAENLLRCAAGGTASGDRHRES